MGGFNIVMLYFVELCMTNCLAKRNLLCYTKLARYNRKIKLDTIEHLVYFFRVKNYHHSSNHCKKR